jgi:hypothetical protein
MNPNKKGSKIGNGFRAGVRDTEPLIRLDDPGYVAAQWTDEQLMQVLSLIPESQRTQAQTNLERIADFCKKLTKEAEKIDQRDTEALKILDREEKVGALESDLSSRKAELSEKKSSLDVRDGDLKIREAEADSGFSSREASFVEELRTRRQAFEEDCAKRLVAIEAEGKASLADQKAKLDEREAVLNASQAELEQAAADRKVADDAMSARKRRLDRQEESLESARLEALEDARRISQSEIDAANQRRQNAEAMARRASDEFTKAISELAQFDELKRVLGGRKPEAILAEVQSLRAECEKLRDDLLARPETAVGDVSTLKKEKEALLAALNSMQPELERTKIELSKIRVGAIERDGLERQKIALEKTNQALSAKINQLGETVDKLTEAGQTKTSFPELVRMDADEKLQRAPRLDEVKDLRKFTEDLRQRIASAEPDVPLYYELKDVQLLVAGLAMSQLHIFQGISGTGKTSLAKAFAKAIGGHCEDIAVQAGWRDKDDLLGHYNPFDKRYAEKPCLKGLYRVQTPRFADTCSVVLLDEMNLSHPEQYFADFLSALEKNSPDERVIELYESALPNPPAMLRLGRLIGVPENVWFIGTANHDETTKGFADKTVDRAHLMTLPRHEAEFPLIELPRRQGVSWRSLKECFEAAKSKRRVEVDRLLGELTTGPLVKVLEDQFRIGLGNRFDRQARSFLPVFEATGGAMTTALDHLLASRVFRPGKVTARYDISRSNLEAVQQALTQTWKGVGGMPVQCLSSIEADLRTKGKA